MPARASNLLAIVGLVFVLGPGARAQRPGGAGQPAGSARAADTNVVVTSVFLRRDAVQQATQQLAAADKGKPQQGGILGSLRRTMTGDKHQVDAAKRVLGQQAVPLESDGRTLILVIGTDADSAKVVESLSGVKRRVRVAFVNREFADGVSDNTVLKAGMAGAVTDVGTNLWVFLPKPGVKHDKPDHVLSTKVAAPGLWNGLFAADGDAIDVNQLKSDVAQVKSLVGKRDTTPQPAAAPTDPAGSANPAPPSATPAVGDVVIPKIANVKVLAEP
ncbi:MAG: hypothetical protein ABI647_22445, partial [Gemmatimonadota bacterium]